MLRMVIAIMYHNYMWLFDYNYFIGYFPSNILQQTCLCCFNSVVAALSVGKIGVVVGYNNCVSDNNSCLWWFNFGVGGDCSLLEMILVYAIQ